MLVFWENSHDEMQDVYWWDYRMPTDTCIGPEWLCHFQHSCQLCALQGPGRDGSQRSTFPLLFHYLWPGSRVLSRQIWIGSVSLCSDPSSFLPAAFGGLSMQGEAECLLQCTPSLGLLPSSTALRAEEQPPALCLLPLAGSRVVALEEVAGNAQNNSSAVIKLSSGSQAKKSAADFCVVRRYIGTANPGVLLFFSHS